MHEVHCKCILSIGYVMYIKCYSHKWQNDMRLARVLAASSHLMSRVSGRDVPLVSAARRMSQLYRALSWRPLSASCRLCGSTVGTEWGKGGEEGEEAASLLARITHMHLMCME